MPWIPIYIIPNVNLEVAIEARGICIAPAQDERVALLRYSAPNFDTLLERFSTNFGEYFTPAILLISDDTPERLRSVDILASFRDALVASTVPLSRSWAMNRGRAGGLMFSEYLDIYPWNLDRNNEHMICSTPAAGGLHEVSAFHGQSSPALFRQSLRDIDIDWPILNGILPRWNKWAHDADSDWGQTALFRSLNMANAAARMPGGRDMTLYDIGRQVGLWISALEILVHPGGNGRADSKKVRRLLQSGQVDSEFLRSQDLRHSGGDDQFVSPLEYLCLELYRVRNSFLHGNPVSQTDLVLPATGMSIYNYAAPLYRLALTSFLRIDFTEPAPDEHDEIAAESWARRKSQHTMTRYAVETALRTAFPA